MLILRWLERHLEEFVCCTCLVIISVAVISQVIARYIFEMALRWTEETAAYAMVWAVYTGAALCVRERFHIRIMVAVQSLPTLWAIHSYTCRHNLGLVLCFHDSGKQTIFTSFGDC